MKYIPVKYEITVGDYQYDLNLSKGGWSFIRREIKNPRIPPYMQILTDDGWKGVLQADYDKAQYFENHTDIEKFIL